MHSQLCTTFIFSIVSVYPWWLFLLCISAGLIYATALYFRDKKTIELNKPLLYLLIVFRFIAVTGIAFLLMAPLISSSNKTTEKPIIIFAQDNSFSLINSKDSAFYKKEHIRLVQDFTNQLNEKYQVETFTFGDKIKSGLDINYSEKQTDIAACFSELDNSYSGRNIGAIILASDGIYNKGSNPEYYQTTNAAPIYTIAMGDTTINKDAALVKVNHNKFAYIGNKFPVQIIVNAQQLKGQSATLTVGKKNTVEYTQRIDFSTNNYTKSINLELPALKMGVEEYTIKLTPVTGETNIINNVQRFYIDIRDGKEKVAIIANAPHPDISAIRGAIENNENYETELFYIDQSKPAFEKYSLIIAHNINNASIFKNTSTPIWFIGNAPATINTGITIPVANGKANEVEAAINKTFPLFTISDNFKNFSELFPAVQCAFGNYKISASANVLFYQKVGIVETENPLLVFNENGNIKNAHFIGDGLWKWRLRDFSEHNNHTLFNELIIKTVQYLATKADKSFFRINFKNTLLENENIEFDAEVYNASYELINEPEVELTIIDSSKKKFPFVFSKTSNAYHLNAGSLPIGTYSFEAKVKVGDKVFTQSGKFVVSELKIETVNTTANHQLLNKLANKNGGKLIYPNEIEKLKQLLESREDIKTVSYTKKQLNELINIKWIFAFILALLSVEWFIRKRNGSY